MVAGGWELSFVGAELVACVLTFVLRAGFNSKLTDPVDASIAALGVSLCSGPSVDPREGSTMAFSTCDMNGTGLVFCRQMSTKINELLSMRGSLKSRRKNYLHNTMDNAFSK